MYIDVMRETDIGYIFHNPDASWFHYMNVNYVHYQHQTHSGIFFVFFHVYSQNYHDFSIFTCKLLCTRIYILLYTRHSYTQHHNHCDNF